MSGGWTDARIAELERMWADGTPAAAIADALGVTRCAVIGKARRLDLDARAPRGNRRLNWRRLNVKMRALWDDGTPTVRIAKTLGIAECTAHRAMRAMGLPSRGRKTNSHGRGSLTPLHTEAPGPVARAMKPRQPSRAAPGEAQLLPDLAPAASAAGVSFGDAVTIDALTPFTCRWPLGGHGEPVTHFCGAACPSDKPYCAHHTAVGTNAHHISRRMTAPPTSLQVALQGFGYADRFLGGDV